MHHRNNQISNSSHSVSFHILLLLLFTVAMQSAFYHPNTDIMDSNPTQGTDICLSFCNVCIVSRELAMGKFPVQGVPCNAYIQDSETLNRRFWTTLVCSATWEEEIFYCTHVNIPEYNQITLIYLLTTLPAAQPV